MNIQDGCRRKKYMSNLIVGSLVYNEEHKFLEQYLNTELIGRKVTQHPFKVTYYDSASNRLIQVADVFANLYFSQLKTGKYGQEIKTLKDNGKLKFEFKFPLK